MKNTYKNIPMKADRCIIIEQPILNKKNFNNKIYFM